MTVREEVLDQARRMVSEDRQETYGDPGRTLARIAALWDAYLGPDMQRTLTAVDVAMLMALLKIARAKGNGGHADNFIDLIGYGALAAELAAAEKDARAASDISAVE